jgi:hypothetical protein
MKALQRQNTRFVALKNLVFSDHFPIIPYNFLVSVFARHSFRSEQFLYVNLTFIPLLQWDTEWLEDSYYTTRTLFLIC